MTHRIKPADLILPSEITPRSIFEQRRNFLKVAAATGLLGAADAEWGMREAFAQGSVHTSPNPKAIRLAARANPRYQVAEKLTSYQDVTSYNNFYEFGTDKSDPATHAHTLKTTPWKVQIEGMVKRPMTLDLDSLMKLAPIEERIYRLRCVEGWSMVIPWLGYSLSEVLKKVEPLASAKYVEFISLADPAQMPGITGLGARVLAWPYTEGLRLDEAMHPLTLLSLGLYGETLPKQSGAPVRIITPWKYGFKSAKSIVKIRLTDKQPLTSWNRAAPEEYGFFANVNPDVDHPRWSQASEKRIGEGGLFAPKRKTLPFNGYADQVASLYRGMDLKKWF